MTVVVSVDTLVGTEIVVSSWESVVTHPVSSDSSGHDTMASHFNDLLRHIFGGCKH